MENSPILPSITPPPIELTQIQDVSSDHSSAVIPTQEKKNKNYWKVATVFLLILVILCGVVLAYMFMNKQKSLDTQTPVIQLSPSPTSQTVTPNSVDLTENWKTYTEKSSRVTFKYPENWYLQSLLVPHSSGHSSWSDVELFLDDHSFEIQKNTEFSTPIQANFGYMSTDSQTGATTLIKTIAESAMWLKTNVYGSNVNEIDNLIIGGHKAIQLSGEAGPGMLEGQKFRHTLIQMNDGVLVFSLENSPNLGSIYDQILTTIQFTPSAVSIISCSNKILGITLTLPDNSWICKDIGDGYTTAISSGKFAINISSLGRGNYCDPPDTDPNSPRYNPDPSSCVVTPFFTNNVVHMQLFTSYGVDKEIFGQIGNGASVSVTYKNQNIKNFSADDTAVIKTILSSISKN